MVGWPSGQRYLEKKLDKVVVEYDSEQDKLIEAVKEWSLNITPYETRLTPEELTEADEKLRTAVNTFVMYEDSLMVIKK